MTNLVSAFIKAAQSFFVQIRNLEDSYSEEMSEVAHAYLTNLNAATVPVVPELKQVFLQHYIFKFSIYIVKNTGVVYFHFWAKTAHVSDTPYLHILPQVCLTCECEISERVLFYVSFELQLILLTSHMVS
jgi:hypothetical protein